MDISAAILLLAATVAFAAPLIFAALGELISEKTGVINIELDGMMLAGAFCGVWAALSSGSLTVGFIGAAARRRPGRPRSRAALLRVPRRTSGERRRA